MSRIYFKYTLDDKIWNIQKLLKQEYPSYSFRHVNSLCGSKEGSNTLTEMKQLVKSLFTKNNIVDNIINILEFDDVIFSDLLENREEIRIKLNDDLFNKMGTLNAKSLRCSMIRLLEFFKMYNYKMSQVTDTGHLKAFVLQLKMSFILLLYVSIGRKLTTEQILNVQNQMNNLTDTYKITLQLILDALLLTQNTGRTKENDPILLNENNKELREKYENMLQKFENIFGEALTQHMKIFEKFPTHVQLSKLNYRGGYIKYKTLYLKEKNNIYMA